MKGYINSLFQDKVTFLTFTLSFLLIAIETTYVLINFNHIPPFLPIYNKRPWGDARLGTKTEVFIPLGATFSLFLINTLISSLTHPKTPLLSRMIAITNFFVCLFSTVFIIKIISLIL